MKQLTDMVDMPRSEWENLIDEWIFSERDREIMKSAMLDGYSYEQIAERQKMSARQIARIVPKLQKEVFKHVAKKS